MPKYYIMSGDLKAIVDAQDVIEGFYKAIIKYLKKMDIAGNNSFSLSTLTISSEYGFPETNCHDEDLIYDTGMLLKLVGLKDYFSQSGDK